MLDTSRVLPPPEEQLRRFNALTAESERRAGEKLFVMNARWLQRWSDYVSKLDKTEPDRIDNVALMNPGTLSSVHRFFVLFCFAHPYVRFACNRFAA